MLARERAAGGSAR